MAAMDTAQILQLLTVGAGLVGIYSQLRSSQAVIAAKLDAVADRLARMEQRGDHHAGDIADLRTRVSTLGVRVTALEHGRGDDHRPATPSIGG